jgi:hypothetical protein
VNFHGETRRNDTHGSTTDPDAQLYRKARGHESRLAFLGHILLDNRHGLVANICATAATGTAEREAATILLEASAPPGSTLGADKGYDVASFVAAVRALGVTPHVAQKPRERDRRPHDPTRRVCDQSAEAKAGRAGLGLDEDRWLTAQAAASRRGTRGLDAHLHRHRVQPDTHAQPGGDVSLTVGEALDGMGFRPRFVRSAQRFDASTARTSFVNSRSSSAC